MEEQGSKNPVPSPCIGVCVLDEEDICTGCYRSVAEVAAWSSLGNDEKRAVIAISWERARQRGKLL